MNQVIINPLLLSKPIYSKILGRMNKIRDRMQTTMSYYKSSSLLLRNYYRQTRFLHQQLQSGSRSSNFYFSNHCSELMQTLDRIKQTTLSLEKSTILNVERLDKFSQEHTLKAHSKLETEIQKFYGNLMEYGEKSLKIEKSIGQYNKEVAYVRESISKYDNFKDPIHFYNPNQFEKSLEKLDDKFKSLQERQSILVGDVEITLINKKYLRNSMSELKDVIFNVLYSETSCFNSMVGIVVQGCKQRVQQESKLYRYSSISNQLYQIELQSMKKIYNKLLTDTENDCQTFHNPFPVSRQTSQIDPNLKLYEQRYKNVITLRKSYLNSSQQFVNKIKLFLIKMIRGMEKVKKSYSSNLDNTIGPSNKMQKFNKDIWQYLGERQIKKFKLTQTIISSHARAASNIHKKLSVMLKDLQRNIGEKSEFFRQFQQKSNKIIQSHSEVKSLLEPQKLITQQLYQTYQSSIKDSFLSLLSLFSSISQSQSHLYNYLLLLAKQTVSIYLKQITITQYQSILATNKDLFDTLKKRSEESQILDIMNSDERYEILYNPFFVEAIGKGKSGDCIRSQYSKMRDLLQKKNFIVGMAGQYENKKNNGCCMTRNNDFQVHPRLVTDCKLSVKSSNFIIGTLKVFPECVCFITKRESMKRERMILLIPRKQIRCVEKVTVTESTENALLLVTQMGDVSFHYVLNIGQAYDTILKSMERETRQIMTKVPARDCDEINESRSRNNSFVIKNHTSTERHTPNTSMQRVRETKVLRCKKGESGDMSISRQPSSMLIPKSDPITTTLEIPNSITPSLSPLTQPLKLFTLVKQTHTPPHTKRLYSFKLFSLLYSIKQVRTILTTTSPLTTTTKIKWKIQCSTTNTKFQLSEKIVVKITDQKIDMLVSVRETEFLKTYVGGYFKKGIQDMNREIMEGMAEEWGRDCCVEMEERVVGEGDNVEGVEKIARESNVKVKEPVVYLDRRAGKNMEFSTDIKEEEGEGKSEKQNSMKEVVKSKPVKIDNTTEEVKTQFNTYLLLIPLSIVLFKLIELLFNF